MRYYWLPDGGAVRFKDISIFWTNYLSFEDAILEYWILEWKCSDCHSTWITFFFVRVQGWHGCFMRTVTTKRSYALQVSKVAHLVSEFGFRHLYLGLKSFNLWKLSRSLYQNLDFQKGFSSVYMMLFTFGLCIISNQHESKFLKLQLS